MTVNDKKDCITYRRDAEVDLTGYFSKPRVECWTKKFEAGIIIDDG